MQEYSDKWLHKLPKVETVRRLEYIIESCRDKRVVHIGFWGTKGSRERHLRNGTWLHANISKVAREVVGVDHNETAIEEAREQGYEAYFADACDKSQVGDLGITPADLVVAGEIIEHVERPGDFLEAMHPLVADDGLLLLTTPNAYRLTNVMVTLTGKELMNPDHIAIYSWFTLTNLIERHGWRVKWVKTYHAAPRNRRVTRAAVKVQELASRRWPFLAAGLMVACEPVSPTRASS